MNDLVNESQTAYIPGRVLFENIVTAREVSFQVKKNKSKGILFKIDLEKAFDRLNWDFLIEARSVSVTKAINALICAF